MSEPKNLVNFLSNLSETKEPKLHSQKSRSHSVPHFSEINKSDESLETKKEAEIPVEKIEPENEKEDTFVQNEDLLSLNITDDEKHRNLSMSPKPQPQLGFIFEGLLQYLNTVEYDELNSLICLSFLYTLLNNPGVPLD